MNLAQLSSIKTRLGLEQTDTDDDAILGGMLAHCSARFERECNRTFERQEDCTEEFEGHSSELRPSRYPVESVGGFHLKSNETDGFQELSGVSYLLRRKCVISLPQPLGSEDQVLQVTYTGGYVLPGTEPEDGQTALPDDIREACVEQVVYWYQRKNQLGLTSVSGEGGSIQNFSSLDLLPHVKAVLKKHERIVF